jgi:primosomal protein N' (replication factor Y)
LPLPLSGPYDYVVPEALTVSPGDFVAVPLGPREVLGVVWDGADKRPPPKVKLRPVEEKLDLAPLPVVLRRFVDWVADYVCTPQGAVLRLVLRARAALEPPPTRLMLVRGKRTPARMTKARAAVLKLAEDGTARTAAELAKEAHVSAEVVRKLADCGALKAVEIAADAPFRAPVPGFAPPALEPAQAHAAEALRDAVRAARFSATLLDGVTGSGKTEVYFEAIAETLRRGGQALVLLPEIALTVQFLDRFARRFGCRPAEWHSDLASRERRRTWRAVIEGKVRVLIGARSALFLPFPDLRLIVVDEEHERAFKQEDGVIYHARDMAVVRAKLGDFPIVLASATPSLETLVNAQSGRYAHLHLPERHGSAKLPAVEAVDLRILPPEQGQWLAPPLVTAMAETLAAGEQVLLFLNRRGYAPLTLCRACGHRLKCPNCSAWLVQHRYWRKLVCHHCGLEKPEPSACPSCGAEGRLVACGPGIERVAEEVAQRFPHARLALLSTDRPASELRETLAAIEEGRVDIAIGTQLVAKGHHFPKLTLVGVVDADLGLEGGDLRAGERTFQLLQQVAGRAGRGDRPGRALLQTYQADHPVMRALVKGDRDGFLAAEAAARKEAELPPYGRLAALVLSGPDAAQLSALARHFAARAPREEGIHVLGPAPAPLALLRGRHRLRFLVKARRNVDLSAYLRQWTLSLRLPGSVRLAIDVDPQSFL